MLFGIDIISIHVQPHFVPGRGGYPRAHFAFYFWQFLQQLWSLRIGV